MCQTEYERHYDVGTTTVNFDLRLPADLGSDKLLESLEGLAGVRRMRLEPMS